MQKRSKKREMKNAAVRVVIGNKNGKTVFAFVRVLSFLRQNKNFLFLPNMAKWITA